MTLPGHKAVHLSEIIIPHDALFSDLGVDRMPDYGARPSRSRTGRPASAVCG